MAYNTSKSTNISQNQEDFKINLNTQPPIFKYNYFTKELNPIQEDPTEPRTVTITCT